MDHDHSDEGLTHRGSSFGAVPAVLSSDHEPVYCVLGVPCKMVFSYVFFCFSQEGDVPARTDSWFSVVINRTR